MEQVMQPEWNFRTAEKDKDEDDDRDEGGKRTIRVKGLKRLLTAYKPLLITT